MIQIVYAGSNIYKNIVYIYKNIENYNPNKKRKILIVSYDIIVNMLSNKKFNPIVTELFIRGRKLNISFAFFIQSYFSVPKDTGLYYTHYFVMKIPNKQKLKKITFHNSSDIDFKDIMNLYKKCTEKLFFFGYWF